MPCRPASSTPLRPGSARQVRREKLTLQRAWSLWSPLRAPECRRWKRDFSSPCLPAVRGAEGEYFLGCEQAIERGREAGIDRHLHDDLGDLVAAQADVRLAPQGRVYQK